MLPEPLKNAVFAGTRFSGVNWLSRRAAARDGVLVLCYHGVVTGDHPSRTFLYRNTVSVRTFRQQLAFLTRNFRVISASELLHGWQGGRSVAGSAVVTFDDGYRNNLTNAAPVLAEFGIRALFAITTSYIGHANVLWTDEVNLRVLGWPQATIPFPAEAYAARTIEVPSSTEARIALAEKIRGACKRLPESARIAYVESLRQLPSRTLDERDRELYDFLSWDEVRALVSAGHEIASHTISHPILTETPPERLTFELRDSKLAIEKQTGVPCQAIVYPNGNYSPHVTEAAREAGYSMGFVLGGTYASKEGNPFAIARIGVPGHPSRAAFESRASGVHSLLGSLL